VYGAVVFSVLIGDTVVISVVSVAELFLPLVTCNVLVFAIVSTVVGGVGLTGE